MTVRYDGVVRRVARLHPALLWLLYLLVPLVAAVVGVVAKAAGTDLSMPLGLLILLLWALYPLFVVAILTRASPSSRLRLQRAGRGFVFFGVCAVVLFLYSCLANSGIFDEMPRTVQHAASIFAGLIYAALFYLWGLASMQLVEAEKGPARGWGAVAVAWLLFFYLLFFGSFFLHRRVRHLTGKGGKETGPPQEGTARVPERSAEA